jgi:hypothetical protein
MSQASNGNKKEHIRCPARIMKNVQFAKEYLSMKTKNPQDKKAIFWKNESAWTIRFVSIFLISDTSAPSRKKG